MREILSSESKQQSKIRDQSKKEDKFAVPAPQNSALEKFRQEKENSIKIYL